MLDVKDTRNYKPLKQAIQRYIGFDCSRYSDSFLSRRIEVRLRANNINSYGRYLDILKTDLEEREHLNKELTIHTTNFFRDITFWNAFIDEALPTLIALKKEKASKTINVWSAGSSTGEEPLSIAISICEALGKDLDKFTVMIQATDISTATIETAKQAIYSEKQFTEMPKEYRNKYFEKVDEKGFYVPRPVIKQMITYKKGDIVSPLKPRNIDIIFCRNTVIYFGMKTKFNLYVDFYRCLNKGGFFIMGKTEVLLGPAREKFQMFNEHERIYVKE